jgi:alkanesulfonate monooxygenase SsuD/methylene tetrahydromethanopterin reductase-like flavin-dependent oxidoreductase (luciferase family)
VKRVGIELGIRAPLHAIEKAARIADTKMLDYYLIPETHPKFTGVDAFEAIQYLVEKIENVVLGTGIVNVFSRSKKKILDLANKMYYETNKNFVLGLGTSAPIIVENMYKMKFEKPVSRIKTYTEFIKSQYKGPIYWSAIGDKMTQFAAEYADGVIFFLKPESEIRRSIKIIKNRLCALGRNYRSFEIISILPTCVDNNEKKARNVLRLTIANYVGANEFYSKPLEKIGFKKEIDIIRENFQRHDLASASVHVSDEMIEALGVFGSSKECAIKIADYSERVKIKTVIAGFDLSRSGYNVDFFKNLDNLVSKF